MMAIPTHMRYHNVVNSVQCHRKGRNLEISPLLCNPAHPSFSGNKVVQDIHGVKMPNWGRDNEVQVDPFISNSLKSPVTVQPSLLRNDFEEEKALISSDHELRNEFSRKRVEIIPVEPSRATLP